MASELGVPEVSKPHIPDLDALLDVDSTDPARFTDVLKAAGRTILPSWSPPI